MLPESKKEQVKEPPEPTQQELVVKASEEAGFSNTLDCLVNSSEQERYVMLVEEALHRIANSVPVQRSIEESR